MTQPTLQVEDVSKSADVDTRAAMIDVVRDVADKGSAVLYSTHYLHEVEQLGARVVILDRGRVVVDGSIADLLGQNGGSVVEMSFAGTPPRLGERFDVTYQRNVVRVHADDPGRVIGRALAAIGEDVARLQSVEVINPSLETIFLSLTGRRYRPETEDVLAS